jgi:hypothetical protein
VDREVLIAAASVHDIGYALELRDSGRYLDAEPEDDAA